VKAKNRTENQERRISALWNVIIFIWFLGVVFFAIIKIVAIVAFMALHVLAFTPLWDGSWEIKYIFSIAGLAFVDFGLIYLISFFKYTYDHTSLSTDNLL
jgi:hypothetical protein